MVASTLATIASTFLQRLFAMGFPSLIPQDATPALTRDEVSVRLVMLNAIGADVLKETPIAPTEAARVVRRLTLDAASVLVSVRVCELLR